MRGFATVDYPDIHLLLDRLALLRVDADRLDGDDPLLFRELQGRCTLCRSKVQCSLDLALMAGDTAWQGWRDYCPNQASLCELI